MNISEFVKKEKDEKYPNLNKKNKNANKRKNPKKKRKLDDSIKFLIKPDLKEIKKLNNIQIHYRVNERTFMTKHFNMDEKKINYLQYGKIKSKKLRIKIARNRRRKNTKKSRRTRKSSKRRKRRN